MGTNITGIGNANAIGFKSRVTGGMYFPPELKDALVGVWSAYGKSNDSTDRNIIKNKIKDRGGDFVISNAAFKLNSGFGKYEVDFTSWIQTDGVIASSDKVQNSIVGRFLYFNAVNKKEDVPSFKVNITLGQQSKLQYNYIKEDGTSKYIVYSESGIYTIPASHFSKYTGGNAWFGFYQIEGTSIIEQIPSFEGAFVTDGIDDLITSTKTVQEMLGGSTEFTVVSMIHLISSGQDVGGVAYTNYIRTSDNYWTTNRVSNTDKTGIYGYSFKQGTPTVINNVLGDKKDYTTEKSDITSDGSVSDLFRANFSVEGFEHVIYGAVHASSVAWYWTVIANKVLTTDEINQVIAYYNLDRTLRPDILCNITKQGITNDNHADFNDKLIDYSGNGRDIQMNNLAWKGGSGIAAKPFETIKDYTIVSDEARQKLTIYNEFSYKVKSNTPNHYWIVQSIIKDNTSYQVTIITDKDCYWINSTSFINNEGNKESIRKEYPVKANTLTQVTICGLNEFEYPEGIEPTTAVSYVNLEYAGEVTVTFIPSCKGGLLLDGVNDFGKVTGMPIYKDYTVVADREIIDGLVENADGGVALKGSRYLTGAFCFDYKDAAFSFGTPKMIPLDTKRFISYQSKYVSNGISMNIGTATDNDELWIGRLGNDKRYSKIAIRFLMSFPYSMSEFLIERQLKKHKLGTLYPDMVEFRPVITINGESGDVSYANDKWENINIGDYINIGEIVHILLYRKDIEEISNVKVNGAKFQSIDFDSIYNHWNINIELTSKSPQKIDITIDEYIRYEDIVQPYPVLLRFNDENGNEVSWGGKFRVGSTITRIGSAADSNLLPNIYIIFRLLLNGNQVTSSKVIVEKTMVFKAKSAYIFDNNEPKCILSPRLLRIPNPSYKILGYIPDISGHGNHGKINNSAYAEGSGVNEDGSYQFDGVDDFVTIPTVTGGKQVFMKVNSRKSDCYLYDQRNNWTQYLGIVSTKDFIAYNYSNQRGKTYIDGILNENITANDLIDITHNITVTNNRDDVKQYSPCIGTSFARNSFAQMALYDFMLFDNISTDDKIKELNEYIGLSGNIFEFNPPTFTIDLPMAIKSIKVYQGGNEISPGYLYPNKDTEFEVYVSLNDGKYAVDTITVDGVEITKDRVVGEYNIFKFILNGSSEQKIKIHSYEYIMYEDINQPYPVIFKVKDRTTNQIYSWGDRIKIGSSIQLIHGENPNLLPELYSIISYTYEGNSYSYNQLTNLVITVTKTISVSCQKTWKLGSNEPKCILSPKRLKLANSSYKYLGYIPDISGNGNNGVFNNFAFSGMSGANGYTYEYTNTSDFSVLSKYARTINSEKIEFFGYTNAVTFYRKNPTYKGKIKIEGLTSAISSGKVQHFQIYTNSKTNTETSVFKTDGVYDIDVTGIGDATNVYFYVLPANTSESGTLDNPITIEQVGNYEGAICFDGIDDYVTIPTLSKGGKQVLMKVNWNTINSIIYDQRGSGGFAIYCSNYNNPSDPITVPAYKGRNAAGTTYIDGIRNEYIIASQLRNVTHNIVEILDTSYAAGNINPIIGKSYLNANYGKMSLYDFVLFDEVSTDEEIKQLNDIIGIEGDYVQKPDYYWDAYGKSNFDADRGYIKDLVSLQQANSLENFNFAYDKMSGYGGYSFKSFNDSQDSWNIKGDGTGVEIISRDGYSMTVKKLVQNLDWQISNNEYRYPTVLNKELPFKCKSNKNVGLIWQLKYKTEGAISDTTVTLINQQLTPNVPLEINLPYKTQDELTELGAVSTSVYYLLYFSNTTLEIGEEYTVEMLPLYPNGLVFDGVDDYSRNTSIPALADYTYICKRSILNIPTNGATLSKGSHKTNGGAFIADYGNKWQFNFGQYNTIQGIADGINWQTTNNFNGTPINKGNNTDDEGITVGRFSNGYANMVFYKLFLYPRTVDMLSINMVKNMMEEDGIIDLTSKLFTDKYTGDFYEMDFNNDFLIGN